MIGDTVQQFRNTRLPAMKGWNTIVDVHDIADQETPDILNMIFDAGVIGPRPGSTLFAEKPTGETGTPLQMMVTRASDGFEYVISVYISGTATNHFYLRDTVNSIWIPLNGVNAPTFSKILRFGYQTWDNGYGDDRLYFCNGYDDVGRWRLALNYLAVDTKTTDSTLTLNDASRFPQMEVAIKSSQSISGNLIPIVQPAILPKGKTTSFPLGQEVYYAGSSITGLSPGIYYVIPSSGVNGSSISLANSFADAVAGTAISISGTTSSGVEYISHVTPIVISDGTTNTQAAYYGVSGNVLTLTQPLGSVIGSGTAVTPTITDRPGVSKGKILTRWQSHLITANASPGSEITMNYSRIGEPEDFVVAADDVSSGGLEAFNDGFGGITDVKDFGEFLVIEKEDAAYRFAFILNSDLSAQIAQIVPILSGFGMGPINHASSVKAMNAIFYPSASSGFVQLSPLGTGTSSSVGLNVISYNINNTIQASYDFDNSQGIFYRNKLIWSATSTVSQNVEFVYDTIRNSWTRFDSWNSVDKQVYQRDLYFLSKIDGNIYKAFDGYTDNNNAYNAYFYSKLNNYGDSSMPMTMDAIYVEGYMTQSSKIYVDVLFNEKGQLSLQTYKLAIGVDGFYFTNVNIDALGQIPINQGILDSLLPSQLQDLGYFRGYLSVPNSAGFFAVQMKFYSKDPNSIWFLTGHGENPSKELAIPPLMRIDAMSNTPIAVSVINTGAGLLQENGFYILL